MAIGTNFSDNNISKNGGTVNHYLTNDTDKWILIRGTAANISAETGAGYAIGCIAMATDSGAAYYNSGTETTASWTAFNSAAFVVPTSVTDTATTSGNSFRVLTTAGTFTNGGSAIKADLAAGTAGNGLVAITSGDYAGTGLLLINGASSTAGTLAAITATALTSGKGLVVTAGSALTTGGSLLKADLGSSTAGQGLTVVTSGAYTGTGLATITAGAMTTGVGLQITSTTGLTSGSLLNVTSSTAGAIATNGAVSINATGIFTSTSNAGYVNITANSTTAGTVLAVNATGLVTGIGIYSPSAEAGLTSGKYMSLGGGKFTVAKYGATVIAGSAAATPALTLTAGDILLSSGNITLTANSSTITCTGTGTNGMVLTNLYNDVAKTMSGTARTIEIMIGATPYYFLVYPTAS